MTTQPGDAASLLPSSATPWMSALSKTSARILDTDTDAVRRERDPSRCDAAFVPFLAWERSVHYYNPADEAGNRARIASSFIDHTKYGSPQALEQEIALDTGYQISIVEFFQESALVWPYFFVDVLINPGDPTPNVSAVWQSAIFRKNVRDMPAAVRLRPAQPPAPLYAIAAANVSISIAFPLDLPPEPQIYVGAGARVFITAAPIRLRT